MDCPAEEQLIRLALGGLAGELRFDLAGRRLGVGHQAPVAEILARLAELGMGAELLASGPAGAAAPSPAPQSGRQARALVWLLAINAAMFLLEGLAGWWADSSGLLADALDMFADAAVYGTALYAVGRGGAAQLKAARLAGVLQLILALGLFWQVGRHILLGAEPLGPAMMAVSCLALAANLACLMLLAPHRHGGAHLQASYIFSANDVLANLGVILAGALVWWTGAQWPDWLVGSLIGLMVLAGAVRILRLGS
ncbi:MAG: cation transporter [Rhodocyclaceae bacterium]|jgi:Co/Zn/Cd efflux system component|nr:cation transporter [Rhodocyclaceae bacterium]